MEQSIVPSNRAPVADMRAGKPRGRFSFLGLRTRSIIYGIVAAAPLAGCALLRRQPDCTRSGSLASRCLPFPWALSLPF
jgi:hypothetical protein